MTEKYGGKVRTRRRKRRRRRRRRQRRRQDHKPTVKTKGKRENESWRKKEITSAKERKLKWDRKMKEAKEETKKRKEK